MGAEDKYLIQKNIQTFVNIPSYRSGIGLATINVLQDWTILQDVCNGRIVP